MKIRSLPLAIAALLLSLALSEARSRRASSEDDGPLSRDRGLAEGESAAVGVVLRGVTGAQADVPQTPQSRRYSPDYYRAYPQHQQPGGAARKVAVAPATAKPTVAAAPRVVAPTPTPAPKPVVALKPTVAPKPIAAPKPTRSSAPKPLRVAVMPAGIDRSGAPLAKIAVKPTPTPAPKITPLRVAVLPRRAATPPAPAVKPRKTNTPPSGPEPLRVLFRD